MNNQLGPIDRLSIFSTLLGIANYNENLSQSKFQEETEAQTSDIHSHLQLQDEKIDLILSMLQRIVENLDFSPSS